MARRPQPYTVLFGRVGCCGAHDGTPAANASVAHAPFVERGRQHVHCEDNSRTSVGCWMMLLLPMDGGNQIAACTLDTISKSINLMHLISALRTSVFDVKKTRQ